MRHFVVFSGTLLVFALIYVSYQFWPFSKSNQHRFNRRRRLRRRNLPAELKVEIVDCLPVENVVHFLANVPNRLIIHHCAPRVRRIFKMIDQITNDYASIVPAPNPLGYIWLMNGHKYTPQMDIFIRYGGGANYYFCIFSLGTGIRHIGLVGYPADFFNNLIMHYYETKTPAKTISFVAIGFPIANPAPWPTALLQPMAGKIKVEKLKVYHNYRIVLYRLHNKNKPEVEFELAIMFEGNAQCYKQMTLFTMLRRIGGIGVTFS